MARFQIRKRNDGRGPYRWEHIIRTTDGLARGNIYRRSGDDLTQAEAEALQAACDEAGFESRETDASSAPRDSNSQQQRR